MNAEYNRRAAIIEGLRAGRSPTDIIKFFGYPRSTVYDIAQKYSALQASGEDPNNPARKICSKKRKSRTPTSAERADEFIRNNPGTSLRKMSTILGMSKTTMRRIAEEDLRYTSYVLKVRQMLTEATKIKRIARCKLLLSSLKHEASGRIKFFSDEKIFTIDAKVNRKNDRWLAHDPSDVPVVGRTKFPASVHVLSVVSSEGDIMPPYFFLKGQKITKEVYLSVLMSTLHPWITTVAAGRQYIFQQDGAPAHTSNLVQNWISANFDMFWSKEMWPPNSPDLNPLDYFVWGVIERVANHSRHANEPSLKEAIEKAFADLDTQQLKRACSRFRQRIEAVIAAKGSYIE